MCRGGKRKALQGQSSLRSTETTFAFGRIGGMDLDPRSGQVSLPSGTCSSVGRVGLG